ncbi:MAG: phosphoribosylanthranilate isomerase [Thaumarchaeota archaeon]|nr:phosphoribosylanthranilate isomerase [Nitrososphaerota archaeon]
MVRVKICGITRFEDLEQAARYGADAIGLVVGFPRSPRNLSIEKARELRRSTPPFLDVVLVVDGSNQDFLIKAVKRIMPDAVQAYGFDDPEVLKELGVSWVIKPIRSDTEIIDDPRKFDAILFDNSMGRGIKASWDISKRIREKVELPLILAGGLNPENVREAIRIVKPYGVDVSSGVESAPGIKDPGKLKEFIRRVREAESDEL